MKNSHYPLLLFLFLFVNTLSSQNIELSILSIADSLKTNANACVRKNNIEITLESIDKIVIKKNRTVTIFNELGNRHADIYERYDNDTKITRLSAKIYDALGNEIKKFSKNKFTDISAVDGATLYSDSRVKYADYTPTSYPYTIVFESETKSSSTGFIPKWMPIENYFLSTQESNYIINNPNNFELRTKEINFNGFNIKNTSTNNNINYTAKNLNAIKAEYKSPKYFDILPTLLIASNSFTLKKVKGNAANWQEFGNWYHDKLLTSQNNLPESGANRIKELTKNAKTIIEKAKIVYNFVQNNTRYISVQVGIGGWEPIPASEVNQVGYGDCKGLTNYTKALLDAVGVRSYYSIVWAGNDKRNIHKNFASMQGNHAILNIPNNEKNIWLECTSQVLPFGFLGDFTDDRDVLVITPEGGRIKRTNSYLNKDNSQITKAKINLLTNGSVKASVERKSYAIQYYDKFYIENYTEDELQKYYKSKVWDYNNNLEIENSSLVNNKNKIEFIENLDITISKFATVGSNNYLVKPNVFNRITSIPKRYRNRKQSFKIERGFKDIDEFTFTIPDECSIIALPVDKLITNQFGSYNVSFKKLDNKTFKYKREFLLKNGIYPATTYKLYRNFIKKISKYDNLRIELTKN